MFGLELEARRGTWDLRHGETGDRRRNVPGPRRQGGIVGMGVSDGGGMVGVSIPTTATVALHAAQTGMLSESARR